MGDQLDLHRDSVGELRMRGPESAEFHDLAWLLADRTRGVWAHQRCPLYLKLDESGAGPTPLPHGPVPTGLWIATTPSGIS